MLIVSNLQGRSLAAVIFRRMAAKSIKNPSTGDPRELFFSLHPDQRVAIRQKLLEALSNESFAPVRNKIGDAVAEIASQYSDQGRLVVVPFY